MSISSHVRSNLLELAIHHKSIKRNENETKRNGHGLRFVNETEAKPVSFRLSFRYSRNFRFAINEIRSCWFGARNGACHQCWVSLFCPHFATPQIFHSSARRNTPSGTKLRSHCMMMRTTAMLLLAFAFGRAGASKSQVCEDRRAPSAPR